MRREREHGKPFSWQREDAHLINGGALIKVLGEARELLARGDLLLEVLIPQLVRPELRQLGLREVGKGDRVSTLWGGREGGPRAKCAASVPSGRQTSRRAARGPRVLGERMRARGSIEGAPHAAEARD